MRQHRRNRTTRNELLEMADLPMGLHGRAGMDTRVFDIPHWPNARVGLRSVLDANASFFQEQV